MPCLSRLFRSRSSLKSDSKLCDLGIQAGPEVDNTNLTQEKVACLRKQVNEAQHALTQLDVLLSSLQHKTDDPPDGPITSGHTSSSTTVSAAIHLEDMKRSTNAVIRILRKNAPLPPAPTDIPISPPAASTPDLYPAPLRLPRRDSLATAAQHTHPEAPSPFYQEIGFLDAHLRQRHSLNNALPCRKPSTGKDRPTSLPISTRERMNTDTTNSPKFSTEAKTRRLRSMQRPVSRLDDERPLGMEELMTWLRAGHSMREL